ncbi:Asx homology domain-containing protein [Copromyces sp. CBS 386.78]|nr:Asx homology domain-containing protein [Copromyces sp. CBS 386.78]
MAEEGGSSPLSSVLSSPPASPPRSMTGDWDGTHVQETNTAARTALEELAAEELVVMQPAVDKSAVAKLAIEEPAIEKPAVEEPAVKKPVAKKAVAKKPAAKKPAAKKSAAKKEAVEEPAVEEPAAKKPVAKKSAVKGLAVEESAVEEPVVEEPAVEEPTVKKLAVKKSAGKKGAVKKSAVEKRFAKEPDVQEPEEAEGEQATPLATRSASPENKSGPRPSNQLEAQELEEASTSWTAINLPPRRPQPVKKPEVPTPEEEEAPVPSAEPQVPTREEEEAPVPSPAPQVPTREEEATVPSAEPSAAPSPVPKKRKPEVPTREEEEQEEEAAAPSAAPSPVSKKRKPLTAPAYSKQDVADSRNVLKPKLTRGACTPCRENKLKCLKEKPICSRCSESGTHCVYAFEQPRKGLPAAARPVPADGSEPKSLGSSNSHGYLAVQNLAVDEEVDIPGIEVAAVTNPSINGQDFNGLKNEDPNTVTKGARKNASGQTPQEAVLDDDAQSSKGTRRSVSSDGQLDTEPRKRKASDQAKPTSAKKPRQAGAASKKTNLDRKWEAPFVYTDEHSPLTNADLRAILLLPQAWDVLTPEERRDILAKFPDDSHILDAGTEKARPDLVLLRNNDHFRYDCARYLENIERGRHDEQWLQEAWVAHEKHKRGDYDDFLRKEFEIDWATKIPEELLQKTSRKNEMVGRDATGKMSENQAAANEQHKALSGRAKGASVVQYVPPANPASVNATEANGTVQKVAESTQSTDHVAQYRPNGNGSSSTNGAQYTALRFEIPKGMD